MPLNPPSKKIQGILYDLINIINLAKYLKKQQVKYHQVPRLGVPRGNFKGQVRKLMGLMVGYFKIFKTFISQVVPNAFGNEFQILAAVELKLCRLL